MQSPNPIREFHHTPELRPAFATISKYRAITEPHSRISPHSRTSPSFRNDIEISCNHRTPFENFTTLPNFTQLSQQYRNIVQSPNHIREFHHTPELRPAFATISKYRAITEPHSRISPHSRTSLSFRNDIEISCSRRFPFGIYHSTIRYLLIRLLRHRRRWHRELRVLPSRYRRLLPLRTERCARPILRRRSYKPAEGWHWGFRANIG